jgi:probable rRNA maturation factor
VKISVYNSQYSLVISKACVRKQVQVVLETESVFCSKLAIHFVKKKEIAHLHETYFQDPAPTDCISFPIDPPLSTKQEYTQRTANGRKGAHRNSFTIVKPRGFGAGSKLSFEAPCAYTFLGEVFVCCAIAKEYAWNKNLNPYDEALLYLVHGLLHLLGYEDLQKDKREKMRKKEALFMNLLKKHNLGLSQRHLRSWNCTSS